MKRDKKTTVILTSILVFMFAVFGGGTILSALGIDIPFLHLAQSDDSDKHNGKAISSTVSDLSGIQIYTPSESAAASQAAVESGDETNIENGAEDVTTDRNNPFVVELATGSGNSGSSSAGTSSAPAPGQDTGNSSSSSSPTSSGSQTGSGSASENSSSGSSSNSASSGTVVPGNRPKPSGGGGSHSVAVQSVALDQSDVTINRKNTLQLTATVAPQNATNKKVTWTSSNPDVATVDAAGKVTGIGAGTATITATANQKTAECQVSVVVLMDGISLNHTELSIDKGSTEQLTAKIEPEDTTEDKKITWTSSDPEIASVDADGKVTAHKVGKADIKAAAVGATATCEITVTSPMTGIALDKTTLTLNRNTTDTLTVSYLPEDTTDDRTVTWSSSAPEIADVDQQGNVVATGIGTATITAVCGKFTASCDVTVIALIEGVYLDQSEMTVDRGTDNQLAVSIVPLDTTEDKTIIWTSSDPTVATVDSTGKVTGVKIGTTTITVAVGEHTATCNINVVALIHSITLDQTSFKLNKSEGHQFTLTIDPPDTTEDKTVIWSSSNPAVATIDNDGKLLAMAPGNTTITAKVGTHSSTCSVRVRDTFTVTAAAVGNGTVSGGGTVIEDNEITLTATPAVGHHLVSWTNSAGEMREELSFTYAPMDNTTWTATFDIDRYNSDEVKIPDITEGGTATVSPAAPYTYGQTVTYTATPAKGYHFVNWTSNKGDIKTTASFTWTLTGPIVWTPHFEGNVYTVSATAKSPEIEAGGTITGAGTYHYGDTVTLTAVPDSQFKFASWKDSSGNIIKTSTLSFKLDDKYLDTPTITYTANFELDAFVTATYDTTNEMEALAWRKGNAGLYVDFYGDSNESSKGWLTLTLDYFISVNAGDQLLSLTYEGAYFGYTSNRTSSYTVYDTSDQVIATGSFLIPKDTSSKEVDLSINASKAASISKVVFYLSGTGRYHKSDDQSSFIYLDFKNIYIGGQRVSAIKNYNYKKK